MNLPLLAATFCALYVGHQVGDHWVQTSHQASHKGLPGWTGRLACLGHVTTYTLTLAIALAPTGAFHHAGKATVALFVSAATHYFADRRTPLRKVAKILGREEFWTLGVPRAGRDDNPSLGTGGYALDQSWHIGWLWICALILAA